MLFTYKRSHFNKEITKNNILNKRIIDEIQNGIYWIE